MAENLVRRIYGGFKGVDFRSKECNIARSPDSLNMWKNYKKQGGIETRPRLRSVMEDYGKGKVHGLYFLNGEYFVHAGTELFSMHPPTKEWPAGPDQWLSFDMNDAPSQGFFYGDKFGNVLYIVDGKTFRKVEHSESGNAVEGYVPTTTIGRKPSGGGTKYEDVNLLTGKRKNTFVGDGISERYLLDADNIDAVIEVKVNGIVIDPSNYFVQEQVGEVIFNQGSAPSAPATAGQDNVSIEFSKTIPGNREKIDKCTLLQVFDNRVFFSGNPDYPNMVWHCSLNDPSYCSDLDYYQEGLDKSKVTGMVAGNNGLWVFREPSDANTTIFYHTPTQDDQYGKIYPSVHSSISIGCIGKAINFNDDIVFFSERGMEGVSGDVTTEQVVSHRSSCVDSKMLADGKDSYKNMNVVEWNGYLVVFIGNKAYLADSRSKFAQESHVEYDWFYWEFFGDVDCAKVQDGVLYISIEGAIYALSEYEGDLYMDYTHRDEEYAVPLEFFESEVENYWVTALDKFNEPNKLKTTNKRGAVVEAGGEDISVYAKTNNDSDFDLVSKFQNVTDAFAFRLKKKKFKDLQIKFYSKKKFGLETATMECFSGGYIKR